MFQFDVEKAKKSVRDGFCERLKSLREEIGVTQDEFAKALGVSRATIGYYESGERLPDIAFLSALSKRTGCSVEYFLEGKNKVTPSEHDFKGINIDDSQYSTLLMLLEKESFLGFLGAQLQVLKLFEELDQLAWYGANSHHVSVLVEQHATAQFATIIGDVFKEIDGKHRFERKFEVEDLGNEEYLPEYRKQKGKLGELILGYEEALKDFRKAIYNHRHTKHTPGTISKMEALTELAEHDAIEAYRQNLLSIQYKGSYIPTDAFELDSYTGETEASPEFYDNENDLFNAVNEKLRKRGITELPRDSQQNVKKEISKSKKVKKP